MKRKLGESEINALTAAAGCTASVFIHSKGIEANLEHYGSISKPGSEQFTAAYQNHWTRAETRWYCLCSFKDILGEII